VCSVNNFHFFIQAHILQHLSTLEWTAFFNCPITFRHFLFTSLKSNEKAGSGTTCKWPHIFILHSPILKKMHWFCFFNDVLPKKQNKIGIVKSINIAKQ